MRTIQRFKSWRFKVAAVAALVAIAGTASAFYVVGIGTVAPIVASPGPAVFTTSVQINPGAFGDVILGVETGRDFVGPFCTIAVQLGPTNPTAGLVGSSGFMLNDHFNYPPVPPTGAVQAQFVYRPSNDPAHPGWGPGVAAANTTTNDMQAVSAVADRMAAFRAAVAAAPMGAMAPWIDLEVDLVFPNAGFMEFYKFRIVE